MPDVVCYTDDVAALVDEAEALGYISWLVVDDDGTKTLGGERTPLVYIWPEAISLLRVSDEALIDAFSNLEVIGHYDNDVFVAKNPDGQLKYNRLIPSGSVTKTLPNGDEIEVLIPTKIGEFA